MFNKKLSPTEFAARGKMIYDDVAIPVILHGTYNRYEPTAVLCNIARDGKGKGSGQISDYDRIEVVATTSEGEEIHVFGIDQVNVIGIGSQRFGGELQSILLRVS